MVIRKVGYDNNKNSCIHKILLFYYLIFILILFFLIILKVISAESGAPPPGQGDSDGGGPYYGNNDWIIQNGDNLIRSNQTLFLNGNLIIENSGTLTFINVTLLMNCSVDGEFSIVLKAGGNINIFDYDNNPKTTKDRSNITANNTDYEYKFLVNYGAMIVIENSELSECGYNFGDDGKAGLTIKTDEVIIHNSSFHDNFHAIDLYSSHRNQIINNMIFFNVEGIHLTYSNNNNIIGNTFTNNNCGIRFSTSSYNAISNNYLYSNNYQGIWIQSSSHDNQIISNNLSDNKCGIRLYFSNKNKIMNNNIYFHNFEGISLEYSNNNWIINNTISNNIDGIWIQSSNNNEISINNFSNNDKCINLFKSDDNQIIDNVMSNNNHGVCLDSSGKNTITNSTITNSTEYDFYLIKKSYLKVINTTFMRNKVFIGHEDSEFIVQWYLSIIVLDRKHSSISNAKVRIKDHDNFHYDGNFTTDSDGFIKWINLIEYIENSYNGKIIHTPYIITIRKDNLKDLIKIEINQSKEILIILDREIKDWIVNKTEVHINETINLVGNLIIENGGNLTFINVTLIMDCVEDGEFIIKVKEGGSLYIIDFDNNPISENDRSNITANNTEFEFGFLVNSHSGFIMKNSELSECGYVFGDDGRAGLTVLTNDTIIENSSLHDNFNGISLYSSNNDRITNNNFYSNEWLGIYLFSSNNNTIKNNRFNSNTECNIYISSFSNNNQITYNNISNSKKGIWISYSQDNDIINNTVSYINYGIYIDSSSNNTIINSTISNSNNFNFYLRKSSNIEAINTNFSKDKIYLDDEDSEFIVKWYISVKVIDKNQIPIQNAKVQIKDNENGTFNESYLTTSEGFVKWIDLIEFVHVINRKIFYIPYKILTEKIAWKKETTVFLDENKEITLILPIQQKPIAYIDSISPNYTFKDKTVSFFGYGKAVVGNIKGYSWRSNLNGILSTNSTFTKRDLSIGNHIIYFKVIDDNGQWSDEVTEYLTIIQENIPDFIVKTEDINFSKSNPIEHDEIRIYAKIHNIGTEDGIVNVSFYLNNTTSGNRIYTKQTISIHPGNSDVVYIDWICIQGEHKIYVEITNSNPQESNISNNIAYKLIKIQKKIKVPDLTLKASDIWVEGSLKVKETIKIYVKIHNIGDIKATATFKIYNKEPKKDDTNIISYGKITILPNEYYIISEYWIPLIKGNHTILVVIENCTPEELNILNNQANNHFFIEAEENDESSFIPNLKPVTIGTVITLGAITAFFIAGGERGFYKFYITIFLPLYFKLSRNDIEKRLNNDKFTIGRIYGFIESNPSVTYTMIKKELELSNSQTAHHLDRLEKLEFIISKKKGRCKHYYPLGTKPKNIDRIRAIIKNNPGIIQKDIIKITKIKQQTVSKNLLRLLNAGVITVEKKGRKKFYYLIEDKKEEKVKGIEKSEIKDIEKQDARENHNSKIGTIEKSEIEKKAFRNCPFCGEDFKLEKTPKYCPYCKEELK